MWPQGVVGAFAWVGVAVFGLAGIGPAEPAGIAQGGEDVQPCGGRALTTLGDTHTSATPVKGSSDLTGQPGSRALM